MILKVGVEIFKILNKIGIKPKDVLGMGGDIVKMGKSLFNTRINPKLLEYIAKNQKIRPIWPIASKVGGKCPEEAAKHWRNATEIGRKMPNF